MGRFSQADRPIAVRTPLGTDKLLLEKFAGTEGLSQLFRFTLTMLAENPVLFPKLLGQPVSVAVGIRGGEARAFHGIVSRLIEKDPVRMEAGPPLLRYEAEVVPRFWLLQRRKQSRIFQQRSVPEILTAVLGTDGVVSKLQGSYPARDYCVQYRESDYAFVCRLMEEEGIYYYFTHSADNHTMVLADTVQACPALPEPRTILYDWHDGGPRVEGRIRSWEKSQEVRASQYTVWDYHFELPGKHLEATSLVLEKVKAGTVEHPLRIDGGDDLEIYDYPGGHAERFDEIGKDGEPQPTNLQKVYDDAKRVARLRMEEEAVEGLRIRGSADEPRFTPGYRFTLARQGTSDGDYLLSRVEHRASIEGAYTSGATVELIYENNFECIPEALPYRPPLTTPKPRIEGTQTAVVTGPADGDLFLDRYGRVKVQFHWDRQGKKDAGSSCWVRVAQSWAGKGWGSFFWPRLGHEVVVAFEEGDPDRPIIVGSVYNAENLPPLHLPENQNSAGIKSCSVGGDPYRDFNAIIFHDTLDSEHVQIHSEHKAIITSEFAPHISSPGPSVEMTGRLPLPFGAMGSGSGGGIRGTTWRGAIPFSLVTGSMGGITALASPFKKLQFTCGTQANVALFGNNYNHTIGACINHVTDLRAPFVKGLSKRWPKTINALNTMLAVGPSLSGNVNLFVGQNATQTYFGTVLNFNRDSAKYDYDANFDEMKGTLVDMVILALTGLVLVGSVLTDFGALYNGDIQDDGESKDYMTRYWMGLAYLILNKLQALLLKIETVLAMLDTAKANARTALENAKRGLGEAVAVRAPGVSKDVKHCLSTCLKFIGQSMYDSKGALATLIGEPVGGPEEALPPHNLTFGGSYTLNAGDITLRSTRRNPGPLAADPTAIRLQAVGTGKDGRVDISGSDRVVLKAAGLKLGDPGSHIFAGRTELTLVHSSGRPSWNTPQIVLKEGELRLQVNPTTFIKLTPLGIELSCNGVSIDIMGSPADLGIGMLCGTQSIELNKTSVIIDGLNMKTTARLSTEEKALRTARQASAMGADQAGVLQL